MGGERARTQASGGVFLLGEGGSSVRLGGVSFWGGGPGPQECPGEVSLVWGGVFGAVADAACGVLGGGLWVGGAVGEA